MDGSNFVGQDTSKARLPSRLSQSPKEAHAQIHTNNYRLVDLKSSRSAITIREFSRTKRANTSGDIVLDPFIGNYSEGEEAPYLTSELLEFLCQACRKPALTPYLTIYGDHAISRASKHIRAIGARDVQLHHLGVIVRLKQLTSMSIVPRQLRSSLGDFLCRNHFLLIYILR
jgi:hypothetical protein